MKRFSVHEFIDEMLPSGSLRPGMQSYSAAYDGAEAHRLLQKTEFDCEAEVPLLFCYGEENGAFELGGRMDGLWSDIPKILEIKSTRQSLDDIGEGRPAHWAQAMVYAAVYALQHDAEAVSVKLSYVHLPGYARRDIDRDFSRDELLAWFIPLCERLSARLAAEAEREFRRNCSVKDIGFPFEEYRPGQKEMAAAVYRALRDGTTALIQSPTGTGKTMAAVFPALKAMPALGREKIFYLTARGTGRIAALDALERLKASGLLLRTVVITAKEKACAERDMFCDTALCPLADGFFDRLADALDGLPDSGVFLQEDIAAIAEKHRLCPYELSLYIAEKCDFIICDYNYAFDPVARLRRFFDEGGNYSILVDEAHNLVDRAREMFSAGIRRSDVAALIKKLPRDRRRKGDIADMKKAVRALSEAQMAVLRPIAAQGAGYIAVRELPDGLIKAAEEFMFAAEPLLQAEELSCRRELADLYFTCRGFIRAAEQYDEKCVFYAAPGAGAHTTVLCLDPSERLQAIYDRIYGAVLFSATLSPEGYFRRLLQADDKRCVYLPFGSPFPEENLFAAVSPVSTAYRHREETAETVAGLIHRTALARSGNYIAFFPSYKYMEDVLDIFRAQYGGADIIVQSRDMDDAAREAFIAEFSRERENTLVAFSVMGGIFGEGLDLAGDKLIGAVIIGPGMPGVSPERDIIKQYHDSIGEDGFGYAYRMPGIVRVTQAAGRVIRSDTDRGVILLIDERFTQRGTAGLLPPWWLPLRRADNMAGLSRLLYGFWHG